MNLWKSTKKYLWTNYRDRFVIFANIDWQGDGRREDPSSWACHRGEFGRRMAAALVDAKQRGVAGLKIHKMLGLFYRNPDGSLMAIDDQRWDPIWEACGKIGLPVLMHTGDPVAFFQPVDGFNERWEELRRHPDWSYFGDEFPSHEELLAARNRVIEKHPQTIFIGAHVAGYPENLAEVAKWLDQYPNLPHRNCRSYRRARSATVHSTGVFSKILRPHPLCTDGPRPVSRLRPHWRLLETRDESFPYAENPISTPRIVEPVWPGFAG